MVDFQVDSKPLAASAIAAEQKAIAVQAVIIRGIFITIDPILRNRTDHTGIRIARKRFSRFEPEEEEVKNIAIGLAAALLLAATVTPLVAQRGGATTALDKVRIEGWALSMSNVATGANQTIQITINGWSTASQRTHLIQTFLEKKQDGLLRELGKQPELGRFNFPGYMGPDPNNTMRLGTDIRYAMNHPGEDGGRRIVVITPRVIGFREATDRPRTYDYPFTLFEMRFNKAGRGEGRMAYATQIMFDKAKNTVEIENYSSEPVRLNELRLEVVK